MSSTQAPADGQYVTITGETVSISIDTELCKGCDVCVELCPTDVYDAVGGKRGGVPTVARPDDCIDCAKCELACPDFALRVSSHE